MKDFEKMSPYVKSGKLHRCDGLVINKGISIFVEGDTLHKWGNYDDVMKSFNAWVKVFPKNKDCLFLNLETKGISIEDCCYIIRRMSEFSLSGFISEFRNKVNDEDFTNWLNSEKSKVPLKVCTESLD